VRIFLAEKGIEVEHVHIPMRQGAHKAPEILTKSEGRTGFLRSFTLYIRCVPTLSSPSIS
jgi:hypothetical protein